MMKQYVICDIDGTIADNTHRAHLLKDIVESDLHRSAEDMKNDRWTQFYDLCDKDTPYLDMRSIVKRVAAQSNIIYLTGRVERIRQKTADWLWEHKFPGGGLAMRANDDFRPNAAFKLARLSEMGLVPENVLCIFEDNDVDTLRDAGYRVLQVAKGGLR